MGLSGSPLDPQLLLQSVCTVEMTFEEEVLTLNRANKSYFKGRDDILLCNPIDGFDLLASYVL